MEAQAVTRVFGQRNTSIKKLDKASTKVVNITANWANFQPQAQKTKKIVYFGTDANQA